MSILVPKAHQDGSQLGMHKREWSNILSQYMYSSSSFINGAEIASGTLGLTVDGKPIIVSPLTTTELTATGEIVDGIIGLRLNNLMKATSDYNMNGNTLTNVRAPEEAGEVATKYYVDQNIQGLKWKQSVRIASNLNIVTEDHWHDADATLVYTETAVNSGQYVLTSGRQGWKYNSSTEELEYLIPHTLQIVPKTPGVGGSSSSIYNGVNYYQKNSYSINDTITFTSAEIGDNYTDYPSTHTVNFTELLFDDDANTPAYGDIKMGDRVLIKDATPKTMNGIWYFSHTGSLQSTFDENDADTQKKWKLKRAFDFDRTSEISSAAVFVEEGKKNADHSFVVTTNSSSLVNPDGTEKDINSYDIYWSIFGTQQADNVTIYKDDTQNNRFEVTGVLRDINDIYYNYSGLGSRIDVSDGDFLVGDGTTFVAESGNTARTSLGLGTGSHVTFTSLNLKGGALTASHLISNSSDPIVLKSDLSGTVDLSIKNLLADQTVSANAITSTTSIAGNTISSVAGITAGNGLSVTTGDIDVNAGDIINAGSITAQFVTASVALSASYIQLRRFADASEFSIASGYPTQDSLYIAGNSLYFGSSPIGGAGGSGQPKENVLYYGGNIVSDPLTSGDRSAGIYYMRLGVSGSYLSAVTDAAGRASHFQILTGSFQELTGTKVDIDGGTIDGTVIGNSSAAAGTFTDINLNNITVSNKATIADAKISAGEMTGSYGEFTILSGSSVDIDGGNISNTAIGTEGSATGIFTKLTGSTHLYTSLLNADTADINGGTIDDTIIGSVTPHTGTFSHLTMTTDGLFSSTNVNITGGSIDNVVIGSNSTINATTSDYGTGSFHVLTASKLVVPKTGETGYIDIAASDTTKESLIRYLPGAKLRVAATDLTGSMGYIGFLETVTGRISGSQGKFNYLEGNHTLIHNAKIRGGEMTGSHGLFEFISGSVITGSSVDIDGGTIDDTSINNSPIGTITPSSGTFSHLTGTVSYIGDPALHGNRSLTSYKSFGRFLILSASHAEIIDPDNQNRGVFEHLTGSYIEVKNQLSASEGATINFTGNIIKNIGTPTKNPEDRNSAVNRAYIDTVVAIKTSVRLAESGPKTISTITTDDTIDFEPISVGDRILLTAQANESENGIWEVTSGVPALQRPFDYNTGDPAGGYIVLVEEGNGNLQSVYSLLSTGNIGTANITVTKISSQYGVSTDGDGLRKATNKFHVDIPTEHSWDTANHTQRANLDFDPIDKKLILSSSIRVDELKVVDQTGTAGRVQISGSADSYIDNVTIGMTTPSDAKFNNLFSAGDIELSTNKQITTGSNTGTKINLHEANFDKVHVPDLLTGEHNPSGEDLLEIFGSLKLNNSQPSNLSQRIYVKTNAAGLKDLYFENDKIGSGGGTTTTGPTFKVSDFTSIYVTGSQPGDGAFFSGSMIVEGDLHVRGTTTTISSSNTTFQDSIIGLGITGSHSGNEEFNNIGDRGLIFARGPNSSAALPGMWWDGSRFNFAKSATSPSSGSFGTITDRSAIRAGSILATGLRIDYTGGNYSLPTTDGNPNQVLKTDGSGNLSWTNQDGGSNNTLTKVDIPISSVNVDGSETYVTHDCSDTNVDVFNINFSAIGNGALDDLAPTGSAGPSISTKNLILKVTNVAENFFSEGKEFYICLNDIDYDEFQRAGMPGHTSRREPRRVLIGLFFDPGDYPATNTVQHMSSTYFGNSVPYTTYTQDGNTNLAYGANEIGGPGLDYHPAANQFTGGSAFPQGWKGSFKRTSFLLDRVYTDENALFGFKFKWVKNNNNRLELVVNYDNIVYFNKFDSRFS